jgi:type IV pilus assembly protein PilC
LSFIAMRYAYTARTNSGSTSTGVLEADSADHAQQQLRDRGLGAVSVKASDRRKARGWSLARLFWRGGIPRRELMALTSQLAIMARAGIDLAGALDTAAAQCAHPVLAKVLRQVHDDVASGSSVSQAMRRHPDIFNEAYTASVAAGESAGQLPEVLARLARLLRGEIRLGSTVRTLLAYPMVLGCVSFLVICGLVFFVLPQFAGVFQQYEVPLPLLTQVLIDVSSEIRARWWIYVPLAIASIVGLVAFRRSDQGRRFVDGLFLRAYVVRDLTRAMLVGRAFQLMGIMLESGVPLLECIRMVRASVSNVHFRELFASLEHSILNGHGLGETMAHSPFIPPAAAQMVRTGEKTGSLAMVARTMGEYYEEEAEAKLREAATVLEPAIIVIMGIVVGTVVLSVMLPMFDFATFAQKH